MNTRFILEIDMQGRVTLPQEVFDHLGIKPGAKLTMTLLPGGEVLFRAAGSKPKRIASRESGS
jgi:bifunctional DNA-binding transcriptional regulator/antitoxin component of YhaV-PrlF toxin-antitoxin module